MDIISALNDPTPIQMGFFWIPYAIMAGAGAASSWLGNRAASKRHEASIAANEAIDRRRSEDWREYAKQFREHQAEMQERQLSALRAFGEAGGLPGLPGGFDYGMLALGGGGGAPVIPRGGGGQMIPATPNVPPQGDGGMMDAMAMMASGDPNMQPAAPAPTPAPTPAGSGVQMLPSQGLMGMQTQAPVYPTRPNPRSLMGGGNLRGWGG